MEAASRAKIESRAASGDSRAQLELASLLDEEGDHQTARAWVERAAASGDPLGWTLLGEIALSRTPLEVARGLALVRAATAAGNARAAHLAALLAAAGVGQAQSWKTALDLLLQAAQVGSTLAQDTIACTTSKQHLAADAMRTRSSDSDLWRSLTQAVDLTPFFRSPPPHVVSATPRIAVSRGFLPPGVCNWLIARAKPNLMSATVYDRDTGGLIVDPNRNNRAAIFPLVLSDLILLLVRERIASVIDRPASFMEDYERGETDFPQLGWRFRGRKGDALFWWSVDPTGAADPRTLHAGLPPRNGEKWLFSQWVRDRPDALYR